MTTDAQGRDDTRISEIRALHFQDNNDPLTCYECGFGWPCDAAHLLAEVERLTGERDESVANMTATAAAFARLKANSEAWHDDSKRLHNEFMPTARIMDEVLATKDRAIEKAWAERDAAQALSAMTARKFTAQLERAEDLASRLAAAEAANARAADQIMQDVLDLAPDDPEHPDTICISYDALVVVLDNALRGAGAALGGSREQAAHGEG